MFSVRCQTPSADAEEIRPKWRGDGGRGRREEAKRREKSAGVFLSPRSPYSQCPKQLRLDLDVLHLGTRPSPLHDRGGRGPRDGKVTGDCSPRHRSSTPNRGTRETTLLGKHNAPLARLTPSAPEGASLPTKRAVRAPEVRPGPCTPLSSARTRTRPQGPAASAPRSHCLWPTNQVVFSPPLLRSPARSRNSITYNGPHSIAVDARGKSFLDVANNG